jgi:hypothetical protein
MTPPAWQFWIDWSVKGLGTFFTFAAVVVALFGPRLRNWFSPPQLKLQLANPDGMQGSVYTLNRATGQAQEQTKAIWYHARVENKTRATPVAGVHIFLLSIEAPDASGAYQPVWQGNAGLGWRHDPNPKPKTIGYSAECDLCHVLQTTLELKLSPLITGQVPDTFRGRVDLVLTLQARGIEADSLPLRVRVSWNGKWSDDRIQMKRNLIVQQISS